MPTDKEETIYILLLNEGVDVWRPVQGIRKNDDVFLIPVDCEIPEYEEWEFTPGTLVKCREKIFSGGERALVAYERG